MKISDDTLRAAIVMDTLVGVSYLAYSGLMLVLAAVFTSGTASYLMYAVSAVIFIAVMISHGSYVRTVSELRNTCGTERQPE